MMPQKAVVHHIRFLGVVLLAMYVVTSATAADAEASDTAKEAAMNALSVCIYPILLDSAPYTFSSDSTRTTVVQACTNQIYNLNRLFHDPRKDTEKKISLDDDEPVSTIDESQINPAKYLIDRGMKLYDEAVLAIRKR